MVKHFEAREDQLCRDCKLRLGKNPLRLLDCKEEQDQRLIQEAPRSVDYLCPECREHFQQVERLLQLLQVPYQLDHRLVRGLDYYTKTVFEVVPQEAGSQSAVGAGGRYDGLIEELGGKPTPAIGFAAGVERVVMNLRRQGIGAPDPSLAEVYVAYLGGPAREAAIRLAGELRAAGVNTLLAFGERSLRAQLRHANSTGARYTVILGEAEVAAGTALLLAMETATQEQLSRAELVSHVLSRLRS